MKGAYHQFALLLAVAAAVGIVALRLRQPLLVAYTRTIAAQAQLRHADLSW